jgi:short-subunit dehydrogenase involved in D-alanine esterification of teichoic acids
MLVTKVLKQNLHLQFVFIGAKSSFDITQAVHYPAYNLAKHLLYQYVKMLREILKQNSSNLTIIAPEIISNEASSSENDINSEQLAHLLVNLASNQIDATHIFSVLTIEKKQLVELKIT